MNDIDIEITTQELSDFEDEDEEDFCDECGFPADECECPVGDED